MEKSHDLFCVGMLYDFLCYVNSSVSVAIDHRSL